MSRHFLPPGAVRVMGILNVTPDSFSDGGKCHDLATAVARGMKLAEEGADIIDVGGESSRPGAEPVASEVELTRVLPVVKELAARGIKVSVDTRRAEVARQALDAGACIINDITAGADPNMFETVRNARAGMVLMRGWNASMECGDLSPLSVGEEAAVYLTKRLDAALAAGIARESLIIDPGIGFTNGGNEDIELLRGIKKLAILAPVMIGVSKKRFLGALCAEPDPARRLGASLAAALFAVSQGAQFLRVHDVAETVQALKVYKALSNG